MGPLERLSGKRVAFDTAPFIYFIEQDPRYLDAVRPIFHAVTAGKLSGITSVVTLLELLVVPYRRGDDALVTQYRHLLLHSRNFEVAALTPDIAQLAAELRARHHLRTPDAIQVASAIAGGATHLLTNDGMLTRVKELEVVVLEHYLAKSD